MKQITIIEQQDNNQFTFYDSRLGSILRKFDGFEYAQAQVSVDDVAGPYGSTYVHSKFGRRIVSIEGDLVSSNVFSLRRTLLKALRQTGTIKLIKFTTYDDLNLQFEAEITKLLNPYTHRVHTFLIEAVAPDWRFYSQTLKSFDIMQSVIRGGASIPASIPMSIQSPMSEETEISNILINDGNEVTDPIITIGGPGTEFLVRNVTTDKEFTLDATLIENDVVVIDVKNRTVIKNGVTNLYPDITGDFFSLVPGENELRFLISSGLTPSTYLNFSYRDAYSGI